MRYNPYNPYGFPYQDFRFGGGFGGLFDQPVTGGAFSPNITSFGPMHGAPVGTAGLPFGYPEQGAASGYAGAPIPISRPTAQAPVGGGAFGGAQPYEGTDTGGLFPPKAASVSNPEYDQYDFGGKFFNTGKFGKKGKRRIKELGYGGAKEFLADNPMFAARGPQSTTGYTR